MATPAVASIHDISLPKFCKTGAAVSVKDISSPASIASKWLFSFETTLSSGKTDELTALIHEDGWWRDQLAVDWEFHTKRGIKNIVDLLDGRLSKVGFRNLKAYESGQFAPKKETPIEDLEWVETMFTFETSVGTGKGMVRLVCLPNGIWKAHMIYTALQELHAAKEIAGYNRPHGGNNSLKGGAAEGNWYERRERQKEFLDEQPSVLIVGAGQSGLNLGARLQSLGLSVLIVDKNERIGDNWRHRYRTLVTHDPVQYTHMAFMKFPDNWPLFTPKDKLADWFEIYASAMELNVWLRSTIKTADFSDDTGMWSVEVTRSDGSTRSMKPSHVVFCTGHAGEPRIPSFPGQSSFAGSVYHGSQHKDATFQGDVTGKKVVVVGTGNSGHDVAQNYYENGASVTMLQRAGTYVISAKTGLFMLHEGLYEERGPPTDDADVFGQSLPIPVQFALNVDGTKRIAQAEKESLDGLRKIGFKLDFGHDGSGIYRKYVTRGGGYYIDVGASQLLIEGKIKLEQSPDGIKGFSEKSLILADGRELEADVVVLATGYDSMNTTLRKAMGDNVADRCKEVWDLDDEGEINAVSVILICELALVLTIYADVETLWPSQVVVHGRKSGVVSHLLEVPGASDQGTRRRAGRLIGRRLVDWKICLLLGLRFLMI
jgi:cation diffusion facilitator CzcD-associated flavoprotein CzcO